MLALVAGGQNQNGTQMKGSEQNIANGAKEYRALIESLVKE